MNSPRSASPYAKFMAQEILRVRALHPELNHKESFLMAADNWKTSDMNPNRLR